MLVLDGSAREHDLATQAAALLSSAFAAQAAAIPVDCMSLGPESSTALRQVAALTGGKHLALPSASAASAGPPLAHRPHAQGEVLVPAMLFHFLPGVAVRRQLNVTQDVQNLSAVCSCHGEAQETRLPIIDAKHPSKFWFNYPSFARGRAALDLSRHFARPRLPWLPLAQRTLVSRLAVVAMPDADIATWAHDLFISCDFLCSLVTRALGNPLPHEVLARLGLSQVSRHVVHDIFCATHIYHAL